MAQVFLIMLRTDIPDGVLQVVDLWPNTSSKNYIYPPGLGQTGYLHNIAAPVIDPNVGTGTPVVALADLTGLAAYLIGNVDPTGTPGSTLFTGAEADTAAAGLVAIAQAGTVLDTAAVDAVLAGVVAGSTLSGGGSTGVLSELLAVLAGRGYQIDAGSDMSDGSGDFAGRVGDFLAGTYTALYDIGRFKVSNQGGNVALLKSANFTYDSPAGVPTTGAAVTVYAEDGTLYV